MKKHKIQVKVNYLSTFSWVQTIDNFSFESDVVSKEKVLQEISSRYNWKNDLVTLIFFEEIKEEKETRLK